MIALVLLGCHADGDLAGGAGEGSVDPFLGGDCSPATACSGGGCGVTVDRVEHAAWFDRLTESPPLTFGTSGTAGGTLEVAFGTAPELQDLWCWDDTGVEAGAPFQAHYLWLADGDVVYAQARWRYADGTVGPSVASAGWTVDIVAPTPVTSIESHRAVTDLAFAWSGGDDDAASGFSHWEAALGSLPGATDLVGWTETAGASFAFGLADVPSGEWAYPSARSVDLAGNGSFPITGEGFVRCPEGYVFVPPCEDEGIETEGFCVEKYEAKIVGMDDGDQGYSDTLVEESRASGTPWASVERGHASIACTAHGMQYTLISNKRWQAVARAIEGADENWSGGAVGAGSVNRGHCDGDPHEPLPASTDDDPCSGTNNPDCTDPASPDWGAKRTHVLSNGQVVWDLSGNIWEHVDGALALDAGGLWTDFESAVFTTEAGWEDRRATFGPRGRFGSAEGMGMFYLGSGELLRGGSFASGDSPGSGGSAGEWDAGLYNGHHNVWWGADETQGFRCVYSP